MRAARPARPDDPPRTEALTEASRSREMFLVSTQVDELMRQELKNLKLAVNREKELPPKTPKKKGGKNVSSE